MQKLYFITLIILTVHFKVFSQCNDILNLGDSIKLCQGGSSLLDAGNTYNSYLWNDNSTNQTLNVTQSGDYHCIVSSTNESINLVLNGDFEQGNILFTSSYTYLPIDDVTGPNAVYGVINNPNTWFNPFSPCPDHTTGTGNMMVIDGNISNGANNALWCQSVTVAANTTYDFNYWIQSVTGAPYANIRVEINGIAIGTGLAPNIICLWEDKSYLWISGANTTAQICLYDLELSGNGNDFAIDDIAMNPVCTYFDTIQVKIADVDTINQSINLCQGESFLVNGNDETSSGIYYEENIVNNCTEYTEYNVLFSPLPSVSAGNDTTVLVGDLIYLNAQTSILGNAYEWSLNNDIISTNQTKEIQALETQTYTLTTYRNNCSSQDFVTINVIESKYELLLPTAFSPNGDNVNDVFSVVNQSDFESIHLQVYNRWGALIYAGFNGNHGWDGKYKGAKQAIGSYIFILNLKSKEQETSQEFGTFFLLR
jgi:gliding motility-associated-like protein